MEIESPWTARKREQLGVVPWDYKKSNSPPCLRKERGDKDGAAARLARVKGWASPLSVLHQAGVNTLVGASYTYDAAGNRTSKTNYLNGVTSNYGYDPLYELTQVTQGGNTTESYSYDAVGNRLSSLGVPNYNYNVSNELTLNSNGSYTYDANGNTLSDAQGRSFTWDFENRLAQAVIPGSDGGTTSFRYDPFGKRIQKAGPLGTTNYLYDGVNSVEEVGSAGNELAGYTQGAGSDQQLAEIRSGISSYYDQDGIGSVTSLSSSTAALASTYTYDSFGNLMGSTGTLTNPFHYAGRELDSETGIYEYRARYYDPVSGRFASEDPFRSLFGLNRYKYVSNRPITLNDPLGLSETCTPDGDEYQWTPWIPTSTSPGVPITGWTLYYSGENGGPDEESGVGAAILNCAWKRMVSKTEASIALIEVMLNCTYQLPCGLQGTYYKSTWEWRHRYSTSNDYETTTTRILILGTDSDFYDEQFCEKNLRP